MRRALSAAVIAASLLAAPRAGAQVHWDASAQVGVMKRFLGDPDPRAPFATNEAASTSVGPSILLAAHVALIPLVHAGVYGAHDVSWLTSGTETMRNITSGGLRFRGMIPFVRGDVRAWIFAGFGYGRSSQAGKAVGPGTTGSAPFEVESASGGFFEVPFGLGASYKVRKPWELLVELGARAGLAHHGDVYEAGPAVTALEPAGPGSLPARWLPSGFDRWALGLSVGVMLDL